MRQHSNRRAEQISIVYSLSTVYILQLQLILLHNVKKLKHITYSTTSNNKTNYLLKHNIELQHAYSTAQHSTASQQHQILFWETVMWSLSSFRTTQQQHNLHNILFTYTPLQTAPLFISSCVLKKIYHEIKYDVVCLKKSIN